MIVYNYLWFFVMFCLLVFDRVDSLVGLFVLLVFACCDCLKVGIIGLFVSDNSVVMYCCGTFYFDLTALVVLGQWLAVQNVVLSEFVVYLFLVIVCLACDWGWLNLSVGFYWFGPLRVDFVLVGLLLLFVYFVWFVYLGQCVGCLCWWFATYYLVCLIFLLTFWFILVDFAC